MWTADFNNVLESGRYAWRYVLEVVEIAYEPRNLWSVASHSGLFSTPTRISIKDVQVEGTTVKPRTLKTTIGAFVLVFTGDLDEICANITRGTFVRLLVGAPGASLAEFEQIAFGQVRQLSKQGAGFRLVTYDAYGACRRQINTAQFFNRLFPTVGQYVTSGAAYTVGDTSIQVADTSLFALSLPGCVKVTPTGGGAPFYLTYTGIASGPARLTGLSSTGVHGTAAAAAGGAASGSKVALVARLVGHPMEIARRVLLTRDGTGTNGTYDVLPAGWGFGMADDMVDHTDMDTFRDTVMTASSGSYEWEVLVESPVEDGYGWLEGWLSKAGMAMTMRQGLMTIRAVQDSQVAAYHSGITITDKDIAEVLEYDAWDELGHVPEYVRWHVLTSLGQTNVWPIAESTSATLPQIGTDETTLNLSDYIFSNWEPVANDVALRTQEQYRGVPERLVLRLAGLRVAQGAVLDIVTLDITSKAQSRRNGKGGWSGRNAVLAEVHPDWVKAEVRVVLWIYPESADPFA